MREENKTKELQQVWRLAPEDAEDDDCRSQYNDAQHIEHDANVNSSDVRLNQ